MLSINAAHQACASETTTQTVIPCIVNGVETPNRRMARTLAALAAQRFNVAKAAFVVKVTVFVR
jgi:hypothetical protein